MSPELLERFSTPILILLTFLAAIFVVVRPLMRHSVRVVKEKHRHSATAKKTVPENEAALINDAEFAADLASIENRLAASDLAKIKQLAISNPEKARQLVQVWLHEK